MTEATPRRAKHGEITAEEVRAVKFARVIGRGYEQSDVDTFVHNCAAWIEWFTDQLNSAQLETAQLRDQVSSAVGDDRAHQAISVLTNAQQTADTTIKQADQYSLRVMSEAKTAYEEARVRAADLEQEMEVRAKARWEDASVHAETLERESDSRARALWEDASVRAETLVRESDSRARALWDDASARAETLEREARVTADALYQAAAERAAELDRETETRARSLDETADQRVAELEEQTRMTRAKADALYQEVAERAAELDRETDARARSLAEFADQQVAEMQEQTRIQMEKLGETATLKQKELDNQTAYLRTLRDSSRVQMQKFLEGLLDHLADEYGRANPVAAEAAAEHRRPAQPSSGTRRVVVGGQKRKARRTYRLGGSGALNQSGFVPEARRSGEGAQEATVAQGSASRDGAADGGRPEN